MDGIHEEEAYVNAIPSKKPSWSQLILQGALAAADAATASTSSTFNFSQIQRPETDSLPDAFSTEAHEDIHHIGVTMFRNILLKKRYSQLINKFRIICENKKTKVVSPFKSDMTIPLV
ncbi:BgTH12-04009 [Blumeria graminis f. sp. triticale]|uniref:BgTH12-04009 n=1 Tax=Blumeria graminis f. sp. triticale TaxID=1689686 RepID=A0A9W4DDN5_BLUGR|nr:BgTH12-04009 [Blumeria graminis f. sp. triticale]